MDSRRIDPAIRRRLGLPSSMYDVTERGMQNARDNRAWVARQVNNLTRNDPLNPATGAHSGPGDAEYQGDVETAERMDHGVERGRQERYAPPVLPEVAGGPTGITGTLRGNPDIVTGERNGIHRGVDVETDYDAVADYFTKR